MDTESWHGMPPLHLVVAAAERLRGGAYERMLRTNGDGKVPVAAECQLDIELLCKFVLCLKDAKPPIFDAVANMDSMLESERKNHGEFGAVTGKRLVATLGPMIRQFLVLLPKIEDGR